MKKKMKDCVKLREKKKTTRNILLCYKLALCLLEGEKKQHQEKS